MQHRFQDKSEEIVEQVATLLAKVCHHMHPQIVEKIVIANTGFKKQFENFCLNPELVEYYFYEGSDCVFPGLRRSVGVESTGKWKNNICEADKTVLNDNTYPRHIWAYLCAGRGYAGGTEGFYSKSGLDAFELAHIFSHKVEERTLERKAFKTFNESFKPYSFFSSASNVVLIPRWLPKPTDKSDLLKLVFFKRHLDLYGSVTALPGLTSFNEELVPAWYSSIVWTDPELPTNWEENIEKLIVYRASHLRQKYQAYRTGQTANMGLVQAGLTSIG